MNKKNHVILIFCSILLALSGSDLILSDSKNDDIRGTSSHQKRQAHPNFNRSTPLKFPMYPLTDIAIAQSKKVRPVLPDSILSAGNHFKIHYTTHGDSAVAWIDSNSNEIPDRIDKIADAFERSYAVEIEQLNYKLPPSFENGTKPYDIYVIDLNNSFGITVTENVDSTAMEQQHVSSYILFDNDFIGQDFHISGDDAIKSTAAHEFFHAIQLGYVFRKIDSFFFELTAVWMEDQVFDELDNYLYYMDYFFQAPDIPLNGVSFTVPKIFKHIYGSCIFAFYIEENFGRNAIRQAWELMPNKSSMNALNHIFRSQGTNFENEYIKFCIWNFFTGRRSRSGYYSNGTNYPEITLESEESINYFAEKNGSGYHLTAGYFLFHSMTGGDFSARMITDSTHHWKLAALAYDESDIRLAIGSPGQTVEILDVPDNYDILIIPCNIDRYTQPHHVYFKDNPETYTFYLTKEVVRTQTNQKSFSIEKIYPNPFSTRIKFLIKKFHDSPVSIRIFNLRGQVVFHRHYSTLPEEMNEMSWLAISENHNLPAGMYFVQFTSGDFKQTEKIVLCR